VFEVGVVARFSATHRLQGDFGPARQRHGHEYRIEVAAGGPELRDDGTLVDLAELKEAVRSETSALDGRDLDELGLLDGANTTAEALARHLCGAIASRIRTPALARLEVRVWETEDAYGSYAADLRAV